MPDDTKPKRQRDASNSEKHLAERYTQNKQACGSSVDAHATDASSRRERGSLGHTIQAERIAQSLVIAPRLSLRSLIGTARRHWRRFARTSKSTDAEPTEVCRATR